MSQENICVGASILIKSQISNYIEKEITIQAFSYEFYESFKYIFLYRRPPGDCFCNRMSVKLLLLIEFN